MYTKFTSTARILTLSVLALTFPHQLFAAGPEFLFLRSADNFVILSGAAITSTGGGSITGDVGASPIAGSAIGVSCDQVNGVIYTVDATGPACAVMDADWLSSAKGHLTVAYNDAAGRTPEPTGTFLNPNGGNIGGLNLVPELYKFTSTALITGADLTLTGGPDDVWIFQIAADLQVGNGIRVILAGGAQAANVFWQVGTSAVLGTGSEFKGTILADQSITLNTGSTIEGRALAFSGGVTFNGAGIRLPGTPVVEDAPEIALQQPPGVNLADGGSQDFGSVGVGANTSLTFTVANTGTANLTGLEITLEGADAALFTVTANPVSPVSPSGSTTFTVQFAPLSPGAKTAVLHIANNDTDENPFDLTLTGTAVAGNAPEIAVRQPPGVNLADGGSQNFGLWGVGANTSLTFTIANTGTANLTGLEITLEGADAALFTVTANPVSPVSPSGSTTFTVQFAPLSPGLKTAVLHIANNDTDENPFDLTLTGTGVAEDAPEISVQQPAGVNLPNGGSQNFGLVSIGANTSLTFTITNPGTTNLTGLAITIEGADAALFTVTADPVSPVIPGGSTTFTVQFAPLSTGAKTAVLQIANSETEQDLFGLTLMGEGAEAEVFPSTNIVVTAESSITLNPQTGLFEQTVQLANNGDTPVPAFRLLIQSLPSDVQVYNASGSTDGTPYVQHNSPLDPAASIDLVIEYYRANRVNDFQPTFLVLESSPASVSETGPVIAINFFTNDFSGQRFLIEFSATPGRRYAVQYSSDASTWKTANPIITAPANRVQWYDDGPPKTESKPTDVGSRFYQIMQLP